MDADLPALAAILVILIVAGVGIAADRYGQQRGETSETRSPSTKTSEMAAVPAVPNPYRTLQQSREAHPSGRHRPEERIGRHRAEP